MGELKFVIPNSRVHSAPASLMGMLHGVRLFPHESVRSCERKRSVAGFFPISTFLYLFFFYFRSRRKASLRLIKN